MISESQEEDEEADNRRSESEEEDGEADNRRSGNKIF